MKIMMLTTVLAAAASLQAGEITWTGAAGNSLWDVGGNWEGGAVPADSDVAVFDPGAGQEVFTDTGSTASNRKISGFKVLSGDVYVGGKLRFSFCAPTNYIDVAEGATFVSSNRWGAASAGNTVLIKTGRGTASTDQKLGYLAGQATFGIVEVREGLLNKLALKSETDYLGLCANRLHVCNGAAVYVNSYNNMYSSLVVDLDEGAELRLHGSGGGQEICGLRGAGRVVKTSGTSSCALRMKLNKEGDYVFSGEFVDISPIFLSGGTYPFVVSNATALASAPNIYVLEDTLRFAPGIGRFTASTFLTSHKSYNPSGKQVIPTEDLSGNPITIVSRYNAKITGSNYPVSGSGTLLFSNKSSTSTNVHVGQFAMGGGVFGSDGEASNPVKLGDRTDAANDFLLTGATKLFAEGPLVFQNVGDCNLGTLPVEVAQGASFKINSIGLLTLSGAVRNAGTIDVSGPLFFNNADLSNTGLIDVGNAVTFSRMEIGCLHESIQIRTGATVTVDDVTLVMNPMRSGDDELALPKIPSSSAASYAGTLAIGGQGIKVRGRGAEYERTFPGIGVLSRNVAWKFNVATAEDVSVDGGIDFDFPGAVVISAPMALKGPVKLHGGYFSLDAAAIPADGLAFGAGDFTLGSAYLRISNKKSDSNLKLGCGAGSNFHFGRGGSICEMAGTTQNQAQTITLGPLLSDEVGSCFFITRETNNSNIDGSDSKVFVQGGLACHPNGMVKAPIFSCAKTGTGDANYVSHFLKYDSLLGFVSCEDLYTYGFDGGPDSIACCQNAATTGITIGKSEEKTVLALEVNGGNETKVTALTLDGTLHVGNGIDPACVILNNWGRNVNYHGGRIKGSGTLDFGTSEAFIVVNSFCTLHGTSYGNQICPKITGAAGVNYVGMFGPHSITYAHHPGVDVNGANTYSGGTRITGCSVRPSKATAFGSGLVEVGGMLAASGQIRFGTEGLVFANDFKIRGNGVKMHSSSSPEWDYGAMWFERSTTLSGSVEIDTEARIFAADGALAELSGSITGGKLKMFTKGTGEILLSGHSTYTGGTIVTGFEDPQTGMVPSVLKLVHGDSAGTGPIVLENAVLVFENDADITVANDISGVGSFRFAGTGKVTFTGDLSDLSIEMSQFTSGSHSISAGNCFPPFDSMGLTGKDSPTLVFNSPGTYQIPASYFAGDFQIVLTNGAKLDLGDPTGETILSVYRFTGDPADVINGKISETNPRAGLMLFIK